MLEPLRCCFWPTSLPESRSLSFQCPSTLAVQMSISSHYNSRESTERRLCCQVPLKEVDMQQTISICRPIQVLYDIWWARLVINPFQAFHRVAGTNMAIVSDFCHWISLNSPTIYPPPNASEYQMYVSKCVKLNASNCHLDFSQILMFFTGKNNQRNVVLKKIKENFWIKTEYMN